MGRGPTTETVDLLTAAMAHIRSVPYRVSLRWLFYRLLQDGIVRGKDDYDAFKGTVARYRKAFKLGWRPDSLVDDTRRVTYRGWGAPDDASAVANLAEHAAELLELSHFDKQRFYVEVWFEAEAMNRQFLHYCKGVTLRPFKGDYPIEPKWRAARDLNNAWERFGRPVVVLYCGDADRKGEQIPESAMADILEYCDREAAETGRASAREYIVFDRAGLSRGQAVEFGLPENPEKPGEYQWEALDDARAGELITGALGKYVDPELVAQARAETADLAGRVRKRLVP